MQRWHWAGEGDFRLWCECPQREPKHLLLSGGWGDARESHCQVRGYSCNVPSANGLTLSMLAGNKGRPRRVGKLKPLRPLGAGYVLENQEGSTALHIKHTDILSRNKIKQCQGDITPAPKWTMETGRICIFILLLQVRGRSQDSVARPLLSGDCIPWTYENQTVME